VALWDAADLLLRAKRMAARPAADEVPPPDSNADDFWYALLTEAQQFWFNKFVAHFPWVLYGPPTLMTSADGGLTYTFAGGITPMKVEIYRTRTGDLLWPGAYWDSSKDIVWEGNRIRFARGASRTFGDGPYARYVIPPGEINATTAPTLAPDWTRLLLVYHAVKLWAERGGMRDPQPFARLENEFWYDPETAGGVLITIKTQHPYSGLGAIPNAPIAGSLAYIAQAGSYPQ